MNYINQSNTNTPLLRLLFGFFLQDINVVDAQCYFRALIDRVILITAKAANRHELLLEIHSMPLKLIELLL